MDISRVRYFLVFAETGSLVAASEILHISQPALSKALKVLEAEVGTALLQADGRGLKLTKAGLLFKQETAGLLDQWMNIPKKLLSADSIKPTRVGSFEVFTTYFLGQLIQFTAIEALDVHEFGPGKLEEAVANGVIDIGITYLPIPKPGVEFVEVTKIKMGVFGLKKFKGKPLADLPFSVPLTPAEGTPSKVMGLDGWPDHKFPRTIKYRVAMMESAMELCRQGACVAYLPEFVAQLHNKVLMPEYRLVELESPVAQKERLQSVYLVQQKNAKEAALHRQIAKSLRALN